MGVQQAQGSMLRRAALGTAFLLATAMVQPALADDDEPGESGGAAEPAAASDGASGDRRRVGQAGAQEAGQVAA